jgi:thioesterase domain-containing protein/acyl carrier protein
VNVLQQLDDNQNEVKLKSVPPSCLHPQDFIEYCQQTHPEYNVDLFINPDTQPDHYDVTLYKKSKYQNLDPGRFPAIPTNTKARIKTKWSDYSNHPLQLKLKESITPGLTLLLKEKLPSYMIPQHFMLLETFPLTPNGKVDKKKLAAAPNLDPINSLSRSVHKIIPPRGPLETMVADVWKAVLQLNEVSMDDHFFDLGGHSLLGASLIFKLRDMFQIDLFIRNLFEAPTLEKLCQKILQLKLKSQQHPEHSRVVVRLQTNGKQRPFFCVHPVGGTVERYFSLSRVMGEDFPFFAIQHPGVDQDFEQQLSVEQLADLYIKEILSIQPNGPFAIGGWSFGGCIAFEIAHQLKLKGHAVNPLVLMDTPTPEVVSKKSNAEMLMALSLAIKEAYQQEINLTYEELEEIDSNKQIDCFLGKIKSTLIQNNPMSSIGWKEQAQQICRIFKIYKHCDQAMRAYHPPQYDGTVVMFRSQDMEDLEEIRRLLSLTGNILAGVQEAQPSTDPKTNPTFGWEKHVVYPLLVKVIPGTHRKMFDPPHVEVFAEELCKIIKKR